MRRRVVITGMGVVTPVGHSVGDLFAGQLEGRSGIGSITLFDAGHFPTKFAAQVKGFDLAQHVKDPALWADSGANSHFAAAAAQQALADADLLDNSKIDRTRCGVYMGAGEGIHDFENFVSLIARNYVPERRQLDVAGFTQGGLQEFHWAREFEQVRRVIVGGDSCVEHDIVAGMFAFCAKTPA